MRNELEEIGQIEKYLLGEMPVAEKKDFENEILRDPALSEKIKQQQLLMGGMERFDIKKAYRPRPTGTSSGKSC